MLKRRLLLAFILGGVLVVVLGALLPAYSELGWWKVLIIAGGVATCIGVVIQDRMTDTVAIPFRAADWRDEPHEAGAPLSLAISARRHGRRRPQVQVFEARHGGCEEVLGEVFVRDNGDVSLGTSYRCDGEVRIT